MNNYISSVNEFEDDDWIDNLSEIQDELQQSEISKAEFLCKDYLGGKLIFALGSFRICSLLMIIFFALYVP